MIAIYRRPYGDEENSELVLGWPSWDPRGERGRMSIKYSYTRNGRISRGCPEVSMDTAVDMVIFAHEHGLLTSDEIQRLLSALPFR